MVTNRLAILRKARGLGATELARATGVSRQAIHAMESGAFVPNTAVALRLASVLSVSVEDLFLLDEPNPETGRRVQAEVIAGQQAESSRMNSPFVRLCQVGNRTVAVPVEPAAFQLPEADGIMRSTTEVGPAEVEIRDEWKAGRQVLIAGCDPAVTVLGKGLGAAGFDLIPWNCNSTQALQLVNGGRAHIAGCHLADSRGEQDLGAVKSYFGSTEFSIVRFAVWEQGIVVAPKNPLGIREAADFARPGLRLRNRELGSGSRVLLDRLLQTAGITAALIGGYDSLANGHLAAARAVFLGEADACIATRVAAEAFSLDFVPLVREHYDFVLLKQMLKEPAVEACLDLLNRAALRRALGRFAGYETGSTGKLA